MPSNLQAENCGCRDGNFVVAGVRKAGKKFVIADIANSLSLSLGVQFHSLNYSCCTHLIILASIRPKRIPIHQFHLKKIFFKRIVWYFFSLPLIFPENFNFYGFVEVVKVENLFDKTFWKAVRYNFHFSCSIIKTNRAYYYVGKQREPIRHEADHLNGIPISEGIISTHDGKVMAKKLEHIKFNTRGAFLRA